MTPEINYPAIETTPLTANFTLGDIKELLDTNTNKMQSALNSKASKAKVLAIMQDCPCLVKCVNEIQSTNYSNIDSLYSAKHEYAKTKLIDAIEDRFADLVTVSSEHVIPNGKLDIVIKPGSKIVLKYNNRTIPSS